MRRPAAARSARCVAHRRVRGALPRRRRSRAALALAALLAALPAAALAQPGGPDVVDYALGWIRGGYRSPVICTFDGRARQGLRRVLVAPGPRRFARRVDRITFHDLDAREAERCRNPLGGDAPNVVGQLFVTFVPRRPHSDTPKRDFELVLREGALELPIEHGALRIGDSGAAVDALPETDFTGGRVWIREVKPGSDIERMLVDFPPSRRLWFEAEAPDGTRIEMALVQFERR